MGSESRVIIEKLISETLESVSPRKVLDTSVHILDLSYGHVIRANRIRDSKKAEQAHGELITAVTSIAKISSSMEVAIENILANRGTQYLPDVNLLVCKSFSTAREFISRVSRLIPNNEYFGTSYRERSLSELKLAYGLEEGSSLAPLEGKAFILADGEIGQVQKLTESAKTYYSLVPIHQLGKNTHIALKDPITGGIYTEQINTHIGAQVSTESGEITLVNTELGKLPLIRRTYLSKLDLGHMFKKSTPGGDTPLGMRLHNAVNYAGISPQNKALVQKYIDKLDKAHGKVTYIFHNKAAEGLASKIPSEVGFVALTVQYYKENNRLAVIEGRIKRELTKKFKEIAFSLPGSNTVVEDLLEKTRNSIVVALGGKATPLKQHAPVSGSVNMFDKALPKVSYSNVAQNKVKKQPNTSSKTKPIKIVSNDASNTLSLTSLQNLINKYLQDVVSANMGDGDSRNVLNYRTGRLASSAKVEYMSQSREGMITAFYSYMKNPYATFSEGGRQQNPRSRDPKLLISKSIREIAAQKVGNRLRAVVV